MDSPGKQSLEERLLWVLYWDTELQGKGISDSVSKAGQKEEPL